MHGESQQVSFQSYLEAKYAIDEAALNREVLRVFETRFSLLDTPRVLDIGTGTGASIRRLLQNSAIKSFKKVKIVSVDREEASLRLAVKSICRLLTEHKYQVTENKLCIAAKDKTRSLSIDFLVADIFESNLQKRLGDFEPNCIISHAVLDLLPLGKAVALFFQLMEKNGILYLTINYDGRTTIVPAYSDAEFEGKLLAHYDASMDNRDSDSGGSRTGTKLHQFLMEGGFSILGFGASDWSAGPFDGNYREGEASFLRAMTTNIYLEGQKAPFLQKNPLDRWYRRRLAQIKETQLGLIVHQTDIVATNS